MDTARGSPRQRLEQSAGIVLLPDGGSIRPAPTAMAEANGCNDSVADLVLALPRRPPDPPRSSRCVTLCPTTNSSDRIRR
jgi:hypothetical protein